MSAELLDGRVLAQHLRDQLQREVAALKERTGAVPRLMNLLMSNDAAGSFYARSQQKAAEQIGIDYELVSLSPSTPEDEIVRHLDAFNADPAVSGIMIHKPLPTHINDQRLANHVAVDKDIEGLNASNIGNVLLGKSQVIPCTAAAVMEHLKAAHVELRGREVVIVGASEIVGKPLALLLLRAYATVTVCHIATSEAGRLADHVARADVLIVAVGKPSLITGDMIRPGAVVIDVGITRVGDKIIGDVDFASAVSRASKITPVPGGVGPVTVMMLMRNAVRAYCNQKNISLGL